MVKERKEEKEKKTKDHPCGAESKPAKSWMWGVHGELFVPKGRLRDWSRAGFGSGDRSIPRPASFSDLVGDWNAAGDGVTDDTEARLASAMLSVYCTALLSYDAAICAFC